MKAYISQVFSPTYFLSNSLHLLEMTFCQITVILICTCTKHRISSLYWGKTIVELNMFRLKLCGEHPLSK